mmetsp:Transcript_21744/g.38242  ORF Transcript_21744/g.38242 Transcript_21744/m.38242 type:complete len:231 (-) Transcript_21744:289-981(-)
MTSGSPRCPWAVMVASNSIQSFGFSSATSVFKSSPKSSAMSGASRRGKRCGYVRIMTTLLARRNKTSKPSRMSMTSPCHLNVRFRNRSSKARAVDARFRSDVRGPHSARKSSQVSIEGGPFGGGSEVRALSCTVDRKMNAVIMTKSSPKSMMTYFLASTTAHEPILRDMTSDLKVGRLMRDFLAITFRQRGQWCTTSLNAGHSSGRTQKAIHPRLNHTTKASMYVTQEAS